MPLTMTAKDKELKLVDTTPEEEVIFDYDLGGTVILTDLTVHLSNFVQKIVAEPSSYDLFADNNPELDSDVLKLSEYIYKIIDAFNDSFSEVYESEDCDA